MLRIDADEFGADDASADAADLSNWVHTLGVLAVNRRLTTHEEVSVPAGLPGIGLVVGWAGARSRIGGPAEPGSVVQR